MTDTDEDMVLCGRGLDKWYGAKHDRRQVLFGVDVDVRAGECLAVIGVAMWRASCACSPDWCSKARSIRWIRDGASADP